MKRAISVTEPLFKSCCTLYIGYSFEEFNNILIINKVTPLDDSHKDSAAVYYHEAIPDSFVLHAIFLKNMKRSKAELLSHLVHELSHFCDQQMKSKGIDEVEHNEAFSYMLEYYFLSFYKKLKI